MENKPTLEESLAFIKGELHKINHFAVPDYKTVEMDKYSPQRKIMFNQTGEWREKNKGKCAIVLDDGAIQLFDELIDIHNYSTKHNIDLSSKIVYLL